MSLLDSAMSKCVMMDKSTHPDGFGGIVTDWKDGSEFMAAIVFDSSMQARIGQHQGVKSLYTVTTNKSIVMQFHDVFRRVEDGKIFRVTSDGDDKASPKSSMLDIRQVTAEEWTLN